MGGSSYIDSVAFRERDMTNGWTGSADGTREQRHYYAQNWRADVSAIFDNAGAVMEWQKYSAYGVPYLITPGDHNKDGVVNSADVDAFDEDYKDGVVSRADLNKDGVVDGADQTLFTASYAKATVGGRWKLSATSIGSRKGYAGYEHEGFGNDLAAPELAHVRHRVLHFELGRWTRRDPMGYVDGNSLYSYTSESPVSHLDPSGMVLIAVCNIIRDWLGLPEEDPSYYVSPVDIRVCCRAARNAGWFIHCEIVVGDCARWAAPDPVEREHPVTTRPDGFLPNGLPCMCAMYNDIHKCLGQNPHSNNPAGPTWSINPFPVTPGNNCQISTIERMDKCCLESDFKPNWYARPILNPTCW